MTDSEAYLLALEQGIIVALAPEIGTANRPECYVGRSAGGQPIPKADQFFVSFHDATWENQAPPGADFVDAMLGCSCTISHRVGDTAEDRLGDTALPALRDHIALVTSSVMNNRYPFMTAANALLTLTNSSGFVEPMLVLAGMVSIVRRRGDWFHARDKGKTKASDGLTATIRLGNARRIQACGGIN